MESALRKLGRLQLLTAAEVAERLNVSTRFVYEHGGELGRVQVSVRKVRFRSDAVEEYINPALD